MPKHAFRDVTTWVFDLDNTLYPPELRLFDQIERLMTQYITREIGLDADAAHKLRRDYWRRYGTTLAGLMVEHGIRPEPFLREVHDLDLSVIPESPTLRAAILALPGKKYVYTNGSRAHGINVSAARGLGGVFDAIYGIEDAGFIPKPDRRAFESVFALADFDPALAVMFEDDPRNLEVPRALGMQTVLVGPRPTTHIGQSTNDLAGFLSSLTI